MIVIAFGGFYGGIADYADSGVLELCAELEVYLSVEDGGVVSCLLECFEEAVDFCAYVGFLGLEVLLDLGLDGVDCALDLAPADFCLVVLGVDGHTCQQFLHEADEDVIVGLLVLDVLDGREEQVVLASLKLDLVDDFDEDGVDVVPDGFEGLLDVLLEVVEGEHQLALGLCDGGLDLLDVEGEGRESFEVLLGVADDDFEGTDLVVAVLLVVADAADHALLDALGLQADDVEHLADVAAALRALGVSELLARHTALRKIYYITQR